MADRLSCNIDGALAEFAFSGSEEAFRRIVLAYLPLVTGTALRRTGGRRDLADDIAQIVFIDLARRAKSMPCDVRLAGWLHRHTTFVSAKTMRGERRREKRERLASSARNEGTSVADAMAGLDDLLLSLGEEARQAVLMHFVEGRTHEEVGDALGITRAAAQKRIERALAHVRASLGATAGAAGLAAALAPPVAHGAELAQRITATAAAAGRALPMSASFGSWSGALRGAATGVALAAIPLAMAWRAFSVVRAEAAARRTAEVMPALPPSPLDRDRDAILAAGLTVDEFVAAVLALPESYGFSELAAARAAALATSLPSESVQAAIMTLSHRLPEDMRLANEWPRHVFTSLCALWAPRSVPADFLTVVRVLPESILSRGSCLGNLATATARMDPGATGRFIHSLRASPRIEGWSKQHRHNVIYALTEAATGEALQRNPAEALELMAALLAQPHFPDSSRPRDVQVGLDVLEKGAHDSSVRADLVEALAAVTHPRARALLEPRLMNQQPVSEWQRFVEAVPDPALRALSATTATASGLAFSGPSKPDRSDLLAWWESHVPADQRPELAAELARTWPPAEYAELLTWVEGLGEREGGAEFDRLRAVAAEVLAPREGDGPNPPRILAPDLAVRMVDPDRRIAVLASVMRAWKSPEAENWAKQNLQPEVAADLSRIVNPSW